MRLTPAATWPAQHVDIGGGTAWLRANAGRYGGDPDRMHPQRALARLGAPIASYVLDQSIELRRRDA